MSRFGRLGHRLYTGEVSYDFLARRRRWYVISAVLIAISLAALLGRGLHYGIEFKGGADFRADTRVNAQTVDRMRTALEASGVPDLQESTVNSIGSTQIRVQTRTLNPTTEVPKVRSVIAQQAGTTSDKVAYNLIGASWGSQISQRALIALIVFLVLVTLVIWAYFRNGAMSAAALVALGHDLILTVGIYALVGFTVTPATLIGVLTILGYSLYDTVVVFDKVRENVRDLRSSSTRTYSEAANLAVNQVLVRSINTTVIGVLPVAALLFAGTVILGEGPLKDLSLALFVGMISGAYSSIFIATPLLAQLKERDPEMRKLATRVADRRARAALAGEPLVLPGVPVPVTVVTGGAHPLTAVPVGTLTADPRLATEVAPENRLGDGDGTDGDGTDGDGARGDGADGPVRPTVPVTTVPATSSVPLRPRQGAANRPQPQSKPRSQRKP